jgi:hypothetical protein
MSEEPDRPAYRTEIRGQRTTAVVNWMLAVLTVPAALVAFIFGFAAAMSTDRCAYVDCAHQGPGYVTFGVLFYGGPLVAMATVVVSFFTAKRDWGILIPVAALTFLLADVAILYYTFRP